MTRVILTGLVTLALLVGRASAADAPTLSDLQKLQIQTLAQQMELAQLRAQLAQRDFDQAKSALVQLVTTLHRDGYELDLQTLTYRPAPVPPQRSGDDR